MARGTGRNAEQLVAYIYGLNGTGEVESVAVYKKGRSVKLSGPNFTSHNVHPSNVGGPGGWMREISLVWFLTDMVEVSAPLLNSDYSREQVEKLKSLGEERKKR
jgi:hypothetical protein